MYLRYGCTFCPTFSECKKSREGCEYMGSVAVTSSGVECQRWDAQTPHAHSFTDENMFPDRDWNALANKCRCPDNRTIFKVINRISSV